MRAIVFLFVVACLETWGASATCPRECTCTNAPMRDAPFVMTWMTSWGEEDLPEMHPNEVMEGSMIFQSSTAADAGVDVDQNGIHATCVLMPGANITVLVQQLPEDIMVLSILQAPGCELSILLGNSLASLKSLKALHLQGFGHKKRKQVSGFIPNSVDDMVAHKHRLQELEDEDQEDLYLALAEDALFPLQNLELLDIQYARLVAESEGGKVSRNVNPESSSSILDLSIGDFMSLAMDLPTNIFPSAYQPLPRHERTTSINEDEDLPTSYIPSAYQPLPRHERTASINEDEENQLQIVLLDENNEDPVPYEIYKTEENEMILKPFIGQSNLKYLRVAHARLDKVGTEFLTGLSELHTLTLEHNHIKMLPPAMFSRTPKLRHLSVAHNNILTLENENLIGLDMLLTLDLDFNKIDILGPASFPSIPQLTTLRLLGNPITHVFPNAFSYVNATEELYIGSSDIAAEFHEDTFRQLKSLKTLLVENATLTSLSRTLLEGMPQLSNLTIHGHIQMINYDTFTVTPNLEHLDLSNCHLSKLSMDAFFGLTKLRMLDLSHNNIDELSPGIFDYLIKLRELYLNNNNLTTLPHELFTLTPAKLIQLQENPWHCSCELRHLKTTITNKVRKPAYATCRWEEKTGMTCTKTNLGRLVYDARVAPMCATPPGLKGKSLHKVLRRRLKCHKKIHKKRKPRVARDFFFEENNEENQIVDQTEEEVETIEELEEELYEELHIADHTPAPFEVKDLLDIALGEMPEDSYAPDTEETHPTNSETNPELRPEINEDLAQNLLNNELEADPDSSNSFTRDGSNEISGINNDADIEHSLNTNEIVESRTISPRMQTYRQEKKRFKLEMEEERRRNHEARQAEKHRFKKILLNEKAEHKARLAEEWKRQNLLREQQRQEYQKMVENRNLQNLLREQQRQEYQKMVENRNLQNNT